MSILEEIKNNKINFLKTVLISLMYMVVGLSLSIPGPTLLDLQIAVNCSLEEISYLLPSRAFGYVIGSFAGGFVPQDIDKQPFIVLSVVAIAASLGLLPWNNTHWVLVLNGTFLGTFMGIFEVCMNVFIFRLWGKKSPPFIQFVYFFYGLGALVAPLLVEPFLLPLQPLEAGNSTEIHSFTRDDLRIHIPYGIVAIYSCIIAFIFAVIYCFKRESKAHSSLTENTADDSKISKTKKLLAVFSSMLFIKLYFGNAITFGSFLAPFAVKCKLKLLKSSGAMVTSMFWGTYTIFRIPIIMLMSYISLRNLIILELLVTLVGAVILEAFGEMREEFLWIGVIIIGCGLASVFALALGYLQQHFQLTNPILSLFLISACLGEFLYPAILAKFMADTPSVFTIVCTFCSISSCVVFIVLEFILRKMR